MKKNLKLKNILVLFLCIVSIILISSRVLATEPIITPITGDDYNNAQTITDEGNNSNTSNSNSLDDNLSNNTSNNTNSAKRYNNTNTNKTVPQTGVQDYNIGILLIIAVAAAIYAYKKVKDYNNI